jgi:hypothetical protein
MLTPTLLCVSALLIGSRVVRAQSVPPSGPQGVIAGVIVEAGSYKPIADVLVEIAALERSVRTDKRGAFSLANVPVGDQVVSARALGFAQFRERAVVRANARTDLAIILPKVSALDTVVVTASNLPYSFLEHRAVGLGHFLTREDLEKQGDRRLGDVLSTVPGLGVVQGKAGRGYVLSKRRVTSISTTVSQCPPAGRAGTSAMGGGAGSDVYVPDATECSQGIIAACYARVFLDEQLLNPTSPAEPININEFFSRGLEAIEYYAGPAQLPMQYSRLNSTCGVVVLHTRRSP